MKISITYKGVMKRSFLDGDNMSKTPKKGRNYVKKGIDRDFTHNTVMGVLSRLVGDRRKLYDARASDDYYFSEMEDKVSFEKTRTKSNEQIIMLQGDGESNCPSSNPTGLILDTHPLISSKYSQSLFNVLNYSYDEIFEFMDSRIEIDVENISLNPLTLAEVLENYYKGSFKDISREISEEEIELLKNFIQEAKTSLGADYKVDSFLDTTKEKVYLKKKIYIVIFYMKLIEIKDSFPIEDLKGIIDKENVSGIARGSKASFTRKDFLKDFFSGKPKKVTSRPQLLNKDEGQLDIYIDIPKEKAIELKKIIEDVSVSTFTLGGSGFAYVLNIET